MRLWMAAGLGARAVHLEPFDRQRHGGTTSNRRDPINRGESFLN